MSDIRRLAALAGLEPGFFSTDRTPSQCKRCGRKHWSFTSCGQAYQTAMLQQATNEQWARLQQAALLDAPQLDPDPLPFWVHDPRGLG